MNIISLPINVTTRSEKLLMMVKKKDILGIEREIHIRIDPTLR